MWHCEREEDTIIDIDININQMGCFHACRLLVLLLAFISIALAPHKAYGIRILRGSAAEETPNLKDADSVVGFDAKKELEAPLPSTFDLNGTSKRRVRRGSDPIHNRC